MKTEIVRQGQHLGQGTEFSDIDTVRVYLPNGRWLRIRIDHEHRDAFYITANEGIEFSLCASNAVYVKPTDR